MSKNWSEFRGRLAAAEVVRLRRILAKRLVTFGFSQVQASQLMGTSTSTVGDYLDSDQATDDGRVFTLAMVEGAGERVEGNGQVDELVDQALAAFGMEWHLRRRNRAEADQQEARKLKAGTSHKPIPAGHAK